MQKELEKTINQAADSNNPPISFHTLQYLEGLKKSYWEIFDEIEKVQKNTRLWDYQKKERIEKLQSYQSEINSEFEFWVNLVKKWVTQFPERDILAGDVIIEYYCNIVNYVPKKGEPPYSGALSLQDILDEFLCEKTDKNKRANAFIARIRQISLNIIQKK